MGHSYCTFAGFSIAIRRRFIDNARLGPARKDVIITIKKFISKTIKAPIERKIDRLGERLSAIQRQLKNARTAFSNDTSAYRMEIDRIGEFQVAFRKGTADEEVIKHSFDNDIFFPAVPEYRIEPDHVIIDVGAHIGTLSLLAAAKVSNGRVFAIEACRETFNYLKANIALNGLDNIEACHLALSDRKGSAMLYYDDVKGNWGHTMEKRLSNYNEEVPTDSLTNFMSDHRIEHCHFMKMNCEGAEFRILLSSSPQTLHRFGVILALYHCDLVEDRTEKDLENHLNKCGFTTTIRNQTGRRGWLVAQNINAPDSFLAKLTRRVHLVSTAPVSTAVPVQ